MCDLSSYFKDNMCDLSLYFTDNMCDLSLYFKDNMCYLFCFSYYKDSVYHLSDIARKPFIVFFLMQVFCADTDTDQCEEEKLFEVKNFV